MERATSRRDVTIRAGLPQPCGPIVGRERELELVAQLLREETRLVTLTGTGGTGKTCLAIHAAAAPSSVPKRRVIYVPLAALRDPAGVPAAIARSVGLREAGARGLVQQLVACLARRPTLLVLDNFEQVIDAAPLIAELLANTTRLQILATSRSNLRISAERELPVPPLGVNDAVQLLVSRSQAVDATFALTEANAPLVAEICRRLDGLPLAIELAAARTRLLSLPEILERTERPLELLTSGRRDAPARQRTLRATIDWSYDLLDPAEQALFRSLAVFARGCTLESAAAVFGTDHREDAFLQQLESLSDQGLVRRHTGAGTTRIELLETIREYAHQKLTSNGELEDRADRHATHFLRLAETLDRRIAAADATLDELDADYDNFLRALEYRLAAHDARAVRIAAALFPLWSLGGRLSEGRKWSQRVFDAGLDAPAEDRARAFGGAASLALHQADYGDAAALAADALRLFRTQGDHDGVVATLRTLAIVARDQGDLAAARLLASQAVELARGVGRSRSLGLAVSCLGRVEFFAGAYDDSTALHEEAWALLESSGTPGEATAELLFLGWGRWVDRRVNEAAALFDRGLRGARAVDDRWQTALALGGLLRVSGASGDHDTMLARGIEALSICVAIDERFLGAMSLVGIVGHLEPSSQTARLLGAADRLRESVGAHWPAMLAAEYRRAMEAARAKLAADELTVAFSGGRVTTLETVLREVEETVAAKASAHELTDRELEVLRLVADGMSNRDVALALVLSERTVHAHLRSTYRKLGINSRSAATRYALEHGYA